MTSTAEVLAELGRIEPRLAEYAASAPADTYDICAKVLAEDSSALRRANAVILACLVAPPVAGAALVEQALQDSDYLVRLSAVRCFATFPTFEAAKGQPLLRSALADADPGVRKYALKMVQQHNLTGLAAEIESIRRTDPVPFLRELAAKTAGQ